MNYFHLQEPYFLLFIPIFIFLQYYFKPQKNTYFIPRHIYSCAHQKKTQSYLRLFLKWIMFISATIALAAPTLTKDVVITHKKSIDIVLNLDTSGSMSLYGFNEDKYEQTRLQAVQEVVKTFIKERKKDRIGIVIFGDYSAVATPPSYDYETPLAIVSQLKVGIIGKNTALIDSIATATELLKKSKSKSKVIILLSDGEDAGSKIPLEVVLEYAKQYHIKVYTVAIGKSNNNLLKLIAKETKAKNFTAANKNDLTEIYRSIDKLEKSNIQTTKVQETIQIYFYFLAIATAAAIYLALLGFKKREL
jgi:Ca-activated chloride channel family protein